MAWTFRKSKSFGPFRLTASKRGLSLSGGVPGARMSVNTRGQVRRTVSVPGVGLYNTKVVSTRESRREAKARAKYEAGMAEARKHAAEAAEALYDGQTPEQKQAWIDCYGTDRVEFLAEVRQQLVASGHISEGTAADLIVEAIDEQMRALALT